VRVVAYTDLIGLVEAAADVAASVDVTPNEAGAHAGEWETSMVLSIEPSSVHPERGEAGYLGPLAPVLDQINRDGMESVTPNGVLGDPAKSTAEHGQAYLERLTDLLVDHVRAESG
jgi:creatinine amidohydrolase